MEEYTKEKRSFVRFVIAVPLRYVEQASKKDGNGKACDLSGQGLGFTTGEDIDLPAFLEIWLEMPGRDNSLYAEGEVVWVRMIEDNVYRVGVNFTRVDFIGLSKILEMI